MEAEIFFKKCQGKDDRIQRRGQKREGEKEYNQIKEISAKREIYVSR